LQENKAIPHVEEQILRLLKGRAEKNFSLVRTNFEIGELLSQAHCQGGDPDIRELALSLGSKGARVNEDFLFDALRVYRTIGSPPILDYLHRQLGGNLTWGFLVRRCTRPPTGDTEEARLYWESVLGRIENALGELENLESREEELPATVREQLSGLLTHLTGGSYADHATGELPDESAPETGGPAPGRPLAFSHIADVHMSEGIKTGGRLIIDPGTGKNERLTDIFRCLDFAVEESIRRGASVFLMAGDLVDSPRPSPNEQAFLRVALEKAAAHAPVVVIPGNHSKSRNPMDATGLEFLKGRCNIHVLERPAILYLEGGEIRKAPSESWPHRGSAKIFCIPYPDRIQGNDASRHGRMEEANEDISNKLRLKLEQFRGELDPGVPNILLMHITVAGANEARHEEMLRYDPWLYPQDLHGFDYVALGHLHGYQQVADNAFYPGSPERVDFAEERQKKGFIIGTFHGRTAHTELIKTPARPYKTLDPDFFRNADFYQELEPHAIYRVKGEVTREDYDLVKAVCRERQIDNRLTVKREARTRDRGMTEDLAGREALRRYLESQEADQETVALCLHMYEAIENEQ
jgi:exonuclease SbcD